MLKKKLSSTLKYSQLDFDDFLADARQPFGVLTGGCRPNLIQLTM